MWSLSSSPPCAACMTFSAASSTRVVPRSLVDELRETIIELMAMNVGDEGSDSLLMVSLLSFCCLSKSRMRFGACIPSAGSQESCAVEYPSHRIKYCNFFQCPYRLDSTISFTSHSFSPLMTSGGG